MKKKNSVRSLLAKSRRVVLVKARKKYMQPVIWKGADGHWYWAVHHFSNCEELFRVSEGNGYAKAGTCRKVLLGMESPHMLPFMEIKAGMVYYDGVSIRDRADMAPWMLKLMVKRINKKYGKGGSK